MRSGVCVFCQRSVAAWDTSYARVAEEQIVEACEPCAFLHSPVFVTEDGVEIMGAASGMYLDAAPHAGPDR